MISHRHLAYVLLPLSLFLLAFRVQEARDHLRAQRILRLVEATTMRAASSRQIPAPLLANNLRRLREASELAPGEVGITIATGTQYLFMGRPDEALEAYGRALAMEARPEVYLNVGRAHLMRGEEDAAVDAFVLAARLSPRLRREMPKELRKKITRKAGLVQR